MSELDQPDNSPTSRIASRPRLVAAKHWSKQWFILGVWVVCVLTSPGCKPENIEEPSTQAVAEQLPSPDPMKVLVIGNPELGPRIARQWAARRDGKITIIDRSLDDWVQQDFSIDDQVDLVIYPSQFVGQMAEQESIRPLSREFWNSEQVKKEGLLKHFQKRLMRYGGEVWGLPLGQPHLAMLFHLESFGGSREELPQTWADLEGDLNAIRKSSLNKLPLDEVGIDLPLAEGWAGRTFLARVAPDIRVQGSFSALFSQTKARPLIATRPFVEALEQLKRITTKRSIQLNPAAVYDLLMSEHSLAGLCLPSSDLARSAADPSASGDLDLPAQNTLAFTSVPGSRRFFDQRQQSWKARDDSEVTHVDLFGFSGMLASVSTQSRYPLTSWELLAWLSDRKISVMTIGKSSQSGPFRVAHLGAIGNWTSDRITLELSEEYAQTVEAMHQRSMVLMFPRIPGVHQYQTVLDAGIRKYLQSEGGQSAEETLTAIAKKWEAITDSLDRKRQQRALQQDIGL